MIKNTKSHRQSEARRRAVMSDEAFVSHAKLKKKKADVLQTSAEFVRSS